MIFKHLQYFPELADQVPRHVLKELCSVAQLDKCPEEDYAGWSCILFSVCILTADFNAVNMEHHNSSEWKIMTASLVSEDTVCWNYIALNCCHNITAPFNNMRTLKFEAQPTNGFFAAVNQVFGGSS